MGYVGIVCRVTFLQTSMETCSPNFAWESTGCRLGSSNSDGAEVLGTLSGSGTLENP